MPQHIIVKNHLVGGAIHQRKFKVDPRTGHLSEVRMHRDVMGRHHYRPVRASSTYAMPPPVTVTHRKYNVANELSHAFDISRPSASRFGVGGAKPLGMGVRGHSSRRGRGISML